MSCRSGGWFTLIRTPLTRFARWPQPRLPALWFGSTSSSGTSAAA